MTTVEFRTNGELVRELSIALQQPIIKTALATLRENGPEFRAQPLGLTPTDAAARLGHICGYAEHHQRLEELAEYETSAQQIEPDYKANEEEF